MTIKIEAGQTHTVAGYPFVRYVANLLDKDDGCPCQNEGWRRGGDIEQPGPLAVGEAIDAAVEMIDRLAALPARITPEQAPDGVRDYCHEAAEGYADGWNACIKAMTEKP